MRTSRAIYLMSLAAAVAFSACDEVKMTSEKVRENYTSFTRITKQPKMVDAGFSGACGSIPEYHKMRSEKLGPHSTNFVHYYLNDVAQNYLDAHQASAYPVDSVIVKEKLFQKVGQAKEFMIEAVAGMIKRKAGSSPETGDWEFFFFTLNPSTGAAIASTDAWHKETNLKNCVGCHSSATDMVFSHFAKLKEIAATSVQNSRGSE